MKPTVFASRPLPAPVGRQLRALLSEAHELEPFSPLRPRAVARRVSGLATAVGLPVRLYRGGVELQGIEVDHVWLASDQVVIDAAFPLFADEFVWVLRHFVAGDAPPEMLEQAAAATSVRQRVLGEFPARVRYLGRPVWSERG